MIRLSATAYILIGAAALLYGAAAEGQNVMTGRVAGTHVGKTMSVGPGLSGVPHSRFRHVRSGRHGFVHHGTANAISNRFGPGIRHHKFDHGIRAGRFGDWGLGIGSYSYGGLGYGGDGAEGYGGYRDSGFFAPYSGSRTAAGDGRVAYNYDRGYPYDHYRGDEGVSVERRAVPRCTTEWGWDPGEGRDVPIRVCRQ